MDSGTALPPNVAILKEINCRGTEFLMVLYEGNLLASTNCKSPGICFYLLSSFFLLAKVCQPPPGTGAMGTLQQNLSFWLSSADEDLLG